MIYILHASAPYRRRIRSECMRSMRRTSASLARAAANRPSAAASSARLRRRACSVAWFRFRAFFSLQSTTHAHARPRQHIHTLSPPPLPQRTCGAVRCARGAPARHGSRPSRSDSRCPRRTRGISGRAARPWAAGTPSDQRCGPSRTSQARSPAVPARRGAASARAATDAARRTRPHVHALAGRRRSRREAPSRCSLPPRRRAAQRAPPSRGAQRRRAAQRAPPSRGAQQARPA